MFPSKKKRFCYPWSRK